ncbi:MAG: arylsulfatase [Verrucomicrobiales bacterium]|nr:arylsulfatase [Verrucomicrobiales bacterium]
MPPLQADETTQNNPPNVIFILADDLGYHHLSCYGQKRLATPHIDSLARQGMLFTDAYAGCTVCGPSRSSLMSGLHSGHIPYKRNGSFVDLTDDTPTLAEIFKQAGYTTGAFGKWGTGGLNSGQTPNDRGFDEFYGILDQGHGHRHYPSYLIRNNRRESIDNITDAKGNTSALPADRKNHTHDLFTEEALAYIEKQKDNRFFCYLAFTLPHTEIIATPETVAEFTSPAGWGEAGTDYDNYTAETPAHIAQPKPHSHFAAELRMIDNSVGAIMKKLKDSGIENNTLVIFTSDNGGQLQSVWGAAPSIFFGDNGPLRGGKNDCYEGGLRVPFIARWPEKIGAGTTSRHPCYFADMVPTIAELTGQDAPVRSDGISILPTLLNDPENQRRHPFLFWSHQTKSRLDHAVRAGKWKAVKRGNLPVEIYDLETDLSETNDLAAKHPDIAAKMQEVIDREYHPDRSKPSPSRNSPVYPNHPE